MALPAFACLLLQTTWVVDDDGGPGVNFTDLPPAIAAAADGDVLLVQPGTYSHFTLSGKGLRILGSGTTAPSQAFVSNDDPATGIERTTVSAVPIGSAVHIEAMRFTNNGPNPSSSWCIEILGAGTRATLADLLVEGPPEGPALLVDAAQARVVRCTISAGAGVGLVGGVGLDARNGAEVHVAGSTLLGGNVVNFPICFGVPGGAGARVWLGGQASFGDTDVLGGNSCCTAATCGADGAAGIRAVSGAFVRVSGGPPRLVQGGTMFVIPSSCTPSFLFGPGPGIETILGAVVVVHSTPVSGGCSIPPTLCGACMPGFPTSGSGITLNAPPMPVLGLAGSLTPGGSATLSVSQGPPNGPFVIAVSTGADFVPLGPPFLGEFLLDPLAWFPFATGVLAGAGSSVTIPLAGIPPALLNVPFHFQAATLEGGSMTWLMSNATVGTIRA
ncbi:MAG: hypothetical protein L0323_07840 [Planctomycetes bacterium]|nr:hypothetical protein [Planctomycetota bacterium]